VSGQINEENILKRMLRIILVAIIFGQMIALHAQQPLDIYGGCINIKGAWISVEDFERVIPIKEIYHSVRLSPPEGEGDCLLNIWHK
jgi:hypothetical protein